MKNSKSLNHIHNGAIDFYYGIKIETNLNFEDLCNNINNKINESIEKYNNYIKTVFQNNIEQAISENKLSNQIHIKETDKSKIMTEINEISDLKNEICSVEFDFTESGFKISPYTNISKYISQMETETKYDFGYSKEFYGNNYLNSQTRFILPPIRVELVNNTTTFLKAMLFVFKNKSAIFRLTLPIDNSDTQPLIANEIDNYIRCLEIPYGFPMQMNNCSIKDIKDCYCQFLAEVIDIESVICFKRIVNVLLANYSDMIYDIKKIPDKFKEDIYKISVAPVQERKGVSYIEEALKHLDNNSYCFNGIGYILSSMGKCISIADNSVLTFIMDTFDKELVFNKIIGDLRRNVEFTIVILLLNNINDSYSF